MTHKHIAIFATAALFLLLALPVRAQAPVGQAADTPWPMYQHDPQHTGRSSLQGPTHQPELLWTAFLPYCSGENGGITIAQDGSLLLPVAGCLHSFDPVTRQVKWTYEFGGYSRSTSLVGEDGNIYWGFGWSFASISSQGGTNWIAQLDANLVFGSSAAFGPDGNLYFVHDGLWSFTPDSQFRWFVPYGVYGAHAAPAIEPDGTIVAGGIQDLCAYHPDGKVVWCIDPPGYTFDKTPAIGADGTIYQPAWGNLEPPYTDSGVLTAISTTGTVEWKFQPEELSVSGIQEGMAIAADGSILFGLNTNAAENYLYSVDAGGHFRWKVDFPTESVTGFNAFMRYPITVDRAGNTFVCPENPRCYGIGPDGSILWQYEFPLVDSIPVVAGTEPVIAADGLLYVFDNHYIDRARLYAFADPLLYPILRTPLRSVEYNLDPGIAAFTATIPITSTVAPITFTASISPSVDWLSIAQPLVETPSGLTVYFDPDTLAAGNYRTHLQIRPSAIAGAWLDIPVTLNIGLQCSFLPLAMSDSRPFRILFASQWFTDAQLASIERTGKNRLAIAHHLPAQVDWVVYAPDGRKAALVPFIDGKHQIIVVDTVTGETILEIVDPVRSRQPTWSPGSDRIAFYSERDDPNGEIYVVNLDGTGLKRLTDNQLHERDLRWSPAGDKIAVEVALHQIYLMNPDGTDFHLITPENEAYGLAGWSPDGQSLLLNNIIGGGMTIRLVVYDLQTSSTRVLTDRYISEPTWSPDGSMIAYTGWDQQNFDWDIVVIRPDGSGETNLTHALDREDSQPAWSPDSRWLAFTSRRDDIANDLNYDIYVVRSDGSGLKQITTNIQNDQYPFWLP